MQHVKYSLVGLFRINIIADVHRRSYNCQKRDLLNVKRKERKKVKLSVDLLVVTKQIFPYDNK